MTLTDCRCLGCKAETPEQCICAGMKIDGSCIKHHQCDSRTTHHLANDDGTFTCEFKADYYGQDDY